MMQNEPLHAQLHPEQVETSIQAHENLPGVVRSLTKPDTYVITCEHAGNRVPADLRHLFKRDKAMLYTHRGYDPGALTLAREMAAALHAPFLQSTTSRLVVDLNRSIGHPRLHADVIVNGLTVEERRKIIERYYLPYRSKAESIIAFAISQGKRVVHISCHSFTPELYGKVRNADFGLLFDPSRSGETLLCRRWQDVLNARRPDCKTRRNYPYIGTSDAFTSYLRRRFPNEVYLGIEIEVNQKHVFIGGRHWRNLRNAVVATFCESVGVMDAARQSAHS